MQEWVERVAAAAAGAAMMARAESVAVQALRNVMQRVSQASERANRPASQVPSRYCARLPSCFSEFQRQPQV